MDPLIENLIAVVGREAVLADPEELLVYECDGLPQHKYLPRAVVFPRSTEDTAEVMRVLQRAGVPFTPRGAGTGLSGGALALERGVVIEMARMRRILNIDSDNRTALVQTGVVNAHVSRAVAQLGLHYVPDPSSQGTCTIGGNIAESAGGIHCLKYGTTTDHVLGVKVVLAGGEVVELGGQAPRSGYDLLGVFIGSEGTFGIATEALLRLVPVPPAVRTLLAEFDDVDRASHAVSAIIAAGVMPAALEMMDSEIIRAVEASVFAAGLPLDIGAALLIELDGLEAGLDAEAQRVKDVCLSYGARNCRLAHDEAERKKLWAARKGAFGAIGRIAPDSMIQDAVVPRSRLPEVMADAYRISSKFDLRLANVFHAGDGNLHPFICFDSRSADQVRRVKEAGRELMETCVRAGGTITGEHGVGLDKRDFLPLIFSEDDMDTMLRVRRAFDPDGLCNPGKIIPLLKGCGEARAVAGRGDRETWGRGETGTGGRGETGTGRRGETETRGRGDTGTEGRSDLRAVASLKGSFDAERAAGLLSQIVGSQNVINSNLPLNPSPLLPINPASHLPIAPSLVVTPASTDEVSEVLKAASNEDWTVVPAGSGAWLDIGNPLVSANIILSTSRLNRILYHEPADLVASAESGVTLDNFNRHLAEAGQFLPLDPPDDSSGTIGGVVATGLRGPHSYGYGAPRNFVIGMKIVLADGRRVQAGGNVVKNVAGYDMCKLFTGSYGTLGLITELTFKLRPLPRSSSTVNVRGQAESLIAGAQRVVGANLFPTAVELFSPAFATELEITERNEAVLLVRFQGAPDAVENQTLAAQHLLEPAGACGAPLIKEDFKLWSRVSKHPLGNGERCIWRSAVPPAHLSDFIRKLETNADDARMWQVSAAEGQIRGIEPPGNDHNRTAQTLQHLRGQVEAFGGSFVIEKADPEVKSRIDAWGEFAASGIMQRIKQQLDPHNILSPGRFRFSAPKV